VFEIRASGARPGSTYSLEEQVRPVLEGLMEAEDVSLGEQKTGLIVVFRKEPEAILGKEKLGAIAEEAKRVSLEEIWKRIPDPKDVQQLKKQMSEDRVEENAFNVLKLIYTRQEMLQRVKDLIALKQKWEKDNPALARHLIGVDTAGSEVGYLNWTHLPALRLAALEGLSVTTHAGEAWEAGNMMGALRRIERDVKSGVVSRIGHATAIGIFPQDVNFTHSYQEARAIKQLQIDLMNEIFRRRITIETNPTSNVMLSEGVIPDRSRQPVQFFHRRGLAVAVSQDNSWILHTGGLSSEFARVWLAHPNFKFSDVLRVVENGHNGSFLNRSYVTPALKRVNPDAGSQQIFDQAA
jgi:adenosine deaminase